MNATCNRFDHHPHVSSQWRETKINFDRTLGQLGCVMIGRSSDGDARRFLLQGTDAMRARSALDRLPMGNATNLPVGFTGTRPVALDATGFTFACRAKYVLGSLVGYSGIHQQDPIHKAKKMDAPLQGAKRMWLGRYLASANDLWLCRDAALRDHVRNLRLPDLRRDDRQNFMAVVRRSGNVTRAYLRDLRQQHRTDGTLAVYELIHRYLMLFFSKKQTILQRVEHAGYVVRFLRLWRLQVVHQPGLSVGTNFYSNQTFRHVLLSCMSAVMYIIACRDLAPARPICLHLLGSDCCEKCFSMAGGWGVTSSWQRNMSFATFLEKCDDFGCLQQMQADGSFRYKAHTVPSKCEFDGRIHGETNDIPDADLTPVPRLHTDDILREYWERGQRQATADATRLGVHIHVPRAVWNRPWEHDPPCRQSLAYLRAHPGSGSSSSSSSSSDDSHESSSSDDSSDEDGGDRAGSPSRTADNNVERAQSRTAVRRERGTSVRIDAIRRTTNVPEDTSTVFNQFEYASCLLHDAASPSKPNSLLTLPNGNQISKRSAIVKLREAHGQDQTISKTRLKRIEQLAASAKQQVDTCGEMVGDKFELHDNLAFAVKDRGVMVLKFARVKKMVATHNGRQNDKIYAISLEDLPEDLRFVVQVYKHVRGKTFSYEDDSLREYKQTDVLGHASMEFDAETGEFNISPEDYQHFNSEIEKRRLAMVKRGKRSQAASARRRKQHQQEARAVQLDRRDRYRGTTTKMSETRQTRAANRMGTTTTTNHEKGRKLEIGMRVRLFHEVCGRLSV